MSDPNVLIPPPLTPVGDVDAALAGAGFAVVGPEGVEALVGAPVAALDVLRAHDGEAGPGEGGVDLAGGRQGRRDQGVRIGHGVRLEMSRGDSLGR